jgi:hypothetical protein
MAPWLCDSGKQTFLNGYAGSMKPLLHLQAHAGKVLGRNAVWNRRLASSACRTPKKLDSIDLTVNASFEVLTSFLIALHSWTQTCTFYSHGVGVGYAVVRWKSSVHSCVVCSFALLCNTEPLFIIRVLKNLWVHIVLLLSWCSVYSVWSPFHTWKFNIRRWVTYYLCTYAGVIKFA